MSGQNYIGSKISLISLSDIRYVGILHSINTTDSTVSLENVRSFGTENRRSKEEEVAASDSVFDFVVFRGSDIKDLQVFEAPSKPSQPAAPPQLNDPAIQASSAKGYPPPMNPYMMPPYPPQAHHQAMYWQPPMYPGQHLAPPPPMHPQQQPPAQQQPQQPQQPQQSQPSQQQQPLAQQQPQQQQKQQAVPPVTAPEAREPQLSAPAKQQEIDGAAVENLAKQVSELDVDTNDEEDIRPATAQRARQSLSGQPQQQAQQSQQQQQQQQQRYNNNNNYRQQNGTRHHQHHHHNNNNQHHHHNKQRVTVPDSDFDFESSNAKFSKDDLFKELTGGPTSPDTPSAAPLDALDDQQEVVIPPANPDGFYDKSKSFFDNISCESKERLEQDPSVDRRGKFHQERKLNMETFGQATVDQRGYRNYRGSRGGRGGYRGGRGGYRSNYNTNNNNNSGNRSYGYNNRDNRSQQVESQ
ncbi:Scd6-like Sm domain-containing protein [Gongronella butleri]|nr:Scd6-like Sm domain-containing protein [Gongronella butleri]